MAKTSTRDLPLYAKYGVYHHIKKQNHFLSTCNKTNKKQNITKIEILIKLLHVLVKKHLDSSNEEFVYFGKNSSLAHDINKIMAKSYGRDISAAEVKTYLNRLCNENVISIKYNPNIAPQVLSMYTDLVDGSSIGKNRTIDFSISSWREIKVNLDFVMELYSVVDFNDPIYNNLDDRSVLKKIITRRTFTSLAKYKSKINELKERVKERNIKAKSELSMFIHFVNSISIKYYNVNSNAFKGQKNEIVTDDGEVLYNEEESKALNDIWRKLDSSSMRYSN